MSARPRLDCDSVGTLHHTQVFDGQWTPTQTLTLTKTLTSTLTGTPPGSQVNLSPGVVGSMRLCCAQITGPVIVPFNVQKQTALLSVMARNFPRLSLGVGPVQTTVLSVLDDATTQTSQITLITVSSGNAQAFAQVRSVIGPSLSHLASAWRDVQGSRICNGLSWEPSDPLLMDVLALGFVVNPARA